MFCKAKNADVDKHKYSGYGIGFNFCYCLLEKMLSVHINNKGKDSLSFGEWKKRKIRWYEVYTIMEATDSYLLMLQKCISSKKKISEKKDYALCLGNISKDIWLNAK